MGKDGATAIFYLPFLPLPPVNFYDLEARQNYTGALNLGEGYELLYNKSLYLIHGQQPLLSPLDLIWFYLVRAEVVLWWHRLFFCGLPAHLNVCVEIVAEAVDLHRS